jgi:hypothetical protein
MRGIAAGFILGGLSGLIALGTQAPDHPWDTAWWIALFAATLLALLIGLWAAGHILIGWPPAIPTHQERTERKARRQHEEHVARITWQEGTQNLLDQLENHPRELRSQLSDGLVFGGGFSGSAWAKNRHLLIPYPGTRDLVRDAYERTHALNQRTEERYNAASQDEVNDPAWRTLTEKETQERSEALEAVEKATATLAEIQTMPPATDPAPSKSREEKLRELRELIEEGEELHSTLANPSTANELTVVKTMYTDLPKVTVWDRRSWRWVEANSPNDLGYLTRYKNNPQKELAVRAMPVFMERRLEALRKVLDRL